MLPAPPIIWINDAPDAWGTPRAYSFTMGDAFGYIRAAIPLLEKAASGDEPSRQQLQAIQMHAQDPHSPERGRAALMLAIVTELQRMPLVAPPITVEAEATAPTDPAPPPEEKAPIAPEVKGPCRRTALPEYTEGWHPADMTCEECDPAAAAILAAQRVAKAAVQPQANGSP